MSQLLDGRHISYELAGFFFDNRKLRDETIAALVETGELSRVDVSGRHLQMTLIVHRSKVADVVKGRPLKKLVEPFRL
jgi:hypothetical protein